MTGPRFVQKGGGGVSIVLMGSSVALLSSAIVWMSFSFVWVSRSVLAQLFSCVDGLYDGSDQLSKCLYHPFNRLV